MYHASRVVSTLGTMWMSSVVEYSPLEIFALRMPRDFIVSPDGPTMSRSSSSGRSLLMSVSSSSRRLGGARDISAPVSGMAALDVDTFLCLMVTLIVGQRRLLLIRLNVRTMTFTLPQNFRDCLAGCCLRQAVA